MSQALDQNWANAFRCGDYERAWQINDASLAALRGSGASKHAGERHHQRIWRGEPLAGQRVLVRCYHGLGDTIQFARFLRPLRQIASEVILWCQPELLPLLRGVDGIDYILPLHDGTPEAAYDIDIEIMELPHVLRATPAQLGAGIPYLHPVGFEPREIPALASVFSVGVLWEAGQWDTQRSIPPAMLAPLAAIPGVRLFSLQPGKDKALLIPAANLAVADIGTLAATLQNLDLVLTVDTMLAHLAGALGVPVWTMLHRDCDWRWPLSGGTTVWYPTMRLFHQRQTGDWTTVVEDVRDELLRVSECRPKEVSPEADSERRANRRTRSGRIRKDDNERA